jgi:hypothetical protein
MDHWWNETERGKLKYLGRNLTYCYFVHHKSQMDGSKTEPLLQWRNPVGAGGSFPANVKLFCI